MSLWQSLLYSLIYYGCSYCILEKLEKLKVHSYRSLVCFLSSSVLAGLLLLFLTVSHTWKFDYFIIAFRDISVFKNNELIIWVHCLPKMAKVCATGTIKLVTPLPLDTNDIFSLPWLPPSIFEDGLCYSASRNMCLEWVSHSPCTGCCRDWWLFCPGHSSGIHWIPAYLFADKASIR